MSLQRSKMVLCGHGSLVSAGLNRMMVLFSVTVSSVPGVVYLFVWGSGGPAQRLPTRRHCGVVDGGPCRPEPTFAWPLRSAAVSPGSEPGSGHYGNEFETPPPAAAAAAPGHPEPGPEGGPGPGGEKKIIIIIIITDQWKFRQTDRQTDI